MKGDKNRLGALEVALRNELWERDFYLINAEKTANPAGKAMFRQIADDELEHYERLKQLHEHWAETNKWPESVPLKVRNTTVRDILKDFVTKAENMPKGGVDDLEAVRTALDFEAKGEKYYAELRDGVQDEREKAFFDLLSRMEREHYLSLADLEELMTDPVSWLRRKEHHGMDGA
ncbi:MAG: ferritin family protein [Syntrophobacterales bacterium]|jgi:rubrerythrin|nr:ferritin family protein [Syntrophobacterales bacterium]